MVRPRRIAITGIGLVTPVGTGVDAAWERLCAGRSGVAAVTAFDADEFPVAIAAEVRDFDPRRFMSPTRARWLERFCQLGCAAAKLAVEDAGLAPDELPPGRTGVVMGSGVGAIASFEREHDRLRTRGARGVSPGFIGKATISAAAASISMELGLTGPSECTSTACASSGNALARGVDLLRGGASDVILAGGSEAAVTGLAVAGFHAVKALSTRNGDPTAASRPFDRARDGFVLGEGASVLALEPLDDARARGATIYAELLGYGLSSDAYHLVAPDPEGRGAHMAMEAALADAGVAGADVGYVNAHAASTPVGDRAEARAIRRLFGADGPAVSSTKSMTGHLIGAAGATEAAITALALAREHVPPTINLDDPDPECDLDLVGPAGRPLGFDVALSNSFAFGGHNVSLVLGRA
jgi:3-oxoacyl-[acyl-carrier-protein] synthase II